MKLPFRLPKFNFSIPFLKKKGADDDEELPAEETLEDGAVAEPEEEAAAAAPTAPVASAAEPKKDGKLSKIIGVIKRIFSGNWTRLVGRVLVGLLAFGAIGGSGATVGWLLINGKHTVDMRNELRPELTVFLLGPTDDAPKNTSLSADKMEETSDAKAKREAKMVEDKAAADAKAKLYDKALVEDTERGPLPIISLDGRQSWIEYAHPFETKDRRPRIAIVMTGLGLAKTITKAVIEVLPSQISLSFSPFSQDLDLWVEIAKKGGHELLVDVPMEPVNYPTNDPGPFTLLTSLNEVENLNRLEWALSRMVGYVGVVSHRGSQFTISEAALGLVLDNLKTRGLMFIDNRQTSRSIATELATALQLPRVFSNLFIDADPSINGIARRLKELERIALDTGASVGLAQPYPITIDTLAAWVQGLEAKGIVLAPVTAVADRQRAR